MSNVNETDEPMKVSVDVIDQTGVQEERFPDTFNVCVIGDVVINWVNVVPPDVGNVGKEHAYKRLLSIPLAGGAWILSDAIATSLRSRIIRGLSSVSTYDNNATKKAMAISYDSLVPQAVWRLKPYPKKLNDEVISVKSQVYRLKDVAGYIVKDDDKLVLKGEYTSVLEQDIVNGKMYDLVAIEDMGLGFRRPGRHKDWEEPIARLKAEGTIILAIGETNLHQGGDQDTKDGLWGYIKQAHPEKTVVVVSGNTLRNAGAIISRRITWEDTVHDLVKNIDMISSLKGFQRFFVRFGIAAAVYIEREGNDFPHKCFIYFNKMVYDGIGRDRVREGDMIGGNSLLAAHIANEIAVTQLSTVGRRPFFWTEDAIDNIGRYSVGSFYKFYLNGYGDIGSRVSGNGQAAEKLQELDTIGLKVMFEKEGGPFFPVKDQTYEVVPDAADWDRLVGKAAFPGIVFKPSSRVISTRVGKHHITENIIDRPDFLIEAMARNANSSDADRIKFSFQRFSEEIVEYGLSTAIKNWKLELPQAKFGKIDSVDYDTVRNYRTMETVIRIYTEEKNDDRPLCVAVFGAPGSGKSFTIKEIASCVSKDIKVETCNITHIGDDDERLINAYVKILDINRKGHLPLMLFDEFDSDGLRHLKRFLEPMEDGTFPYGGDRLHLGRCILVFAGGVFKTYDDFAEAAERAVDLKGPDFLSRFRSHINIYGIDKPKTKASRFFPWLAPPSSTFDESRRLATEKYNFAYLVRRAILLRLFLTDRGLITDTDPIASHHIASEITTALLRVETYVHGTRSLRTIVNSLRKDGAMVTRSGVPPDHHIKMHIADSIIFLDLLQQRIRN